MNENKQITEYELDLPDDERDAPEEKLVLRVAVSGARLDAFISENTSLTRSCSQRLIESGAALVDGKQKKSGFIVKADSIVSIELPKPAPVEAQPQNIPIDIVYQDADIAVINKCAGMVVHPAAGNPDGTLVNALLFHLTDLSGVGGELRPGIVHRIDKNTSGLLVVAKNDAAHNFLSNELKKHAVERTYIAIAEGNFREDSGTVDAPIARHRTDRKRMAVAEGGRSAVTHWSVVERFGDMTLLSVRLETGRTHQIRVHMAYIKHPLVGDEVYGSGKNSIGLDRQALHAAELRLTHPKTGERLEFSAPLPNDLLRALDRLHSRRQL